MGLRDSNEEDEEEGLWESLRPVHLLVKTNLAFQIALALLMVIFWRKLPWAQTMLLGLGVGAVPGFLVGLVFQRVLQPGRVGQNLDKLAIWFLIVVFWNIISVVEISDQLYG